MFRWMGILFTYNIVLHTKFNDSQLYKNLERNISDHHIFESPQQIHTN